MLKQVMHFQCNFVDPDSGPCEKNFFFEPDLSLQDPRHPKPNWSPEVAEALKHIVAVTHQTGYTTHYCSDAHAIEAMGLGQHVPGPSLITGHSETDMKRAAAAAAAVSRMKRVQ
jgi:hypothetical protein